MSAVLKVSVSFHQYEHPKENEKRNSNSNQGCDEHTVEFDSWSANVHNEADVEELIDVLLVTRSLPDDIISSLKRIIPKQTDQVGKEPSSNPDLLFVEFVFGEVCVVQTPHDAFYVDVLFVVNQESDAEPLVHLELERRDKQ